MPDYSVFGGCLRSDISFPDHHENTSDAADWRLRRIDTPPPSRDLTFLGETRIDTVVVVRHYRFDSGFRVVYDDTGTFDISEDGSEILWFPGPEANEQAARLDVVGYVFAAAFHAAGMLCLHGSAVALQSGGIAFLAPKRHGKSTLARALTQAGARLATDDSIPVTAGPPTTLRPGVHQFRLWDDSAEYFAENGRDYRSGYGGKKVLTNLDPSQLVLEPVPLSAVYLLAPMKPMPDVPAARRTLLPPIEATLALVTHAKIGAMLGGSEAASVLDRAGDLAREVPVYRLEIVRDFDQLDAVVEALFAWHGGGVLVPGSEEAA